MSKDKKNKYIRKFNTSGICNPVSHFYVNRTKELEKALEEIKGNPGEPGGRYFTLFSSRQMGKTTFVYELVDKLDKNEYCPVVISFETMIDLDEKTFYQRFSKRIRSEKVFPEIPDFTEGEDFTNFTEKLNTTSDKKFVLIIDEFDGLNKDYLGKLLHTFRNIYFGKGKKYNLHSLILIGVRNITDVNMDNASPFNTNDEIQMPLFTKEQVFDLMGQYETETGQKFAREVKEAIYYNTRGQPGLTNALCKMLTEDFNPGNGKRIDRQNFTEMLSYFIHCHISKNVVNIINKAKNYPDEIIEIFDTNKKVEFNVDTEWIGYLYINGAIDYETEKGKDGSIHRYIRFTNPIYQKKLYNYFRPDLMGERARYFEPGEPLDRYYTSLNRLNLFEIIKNYQRYINRRGSRAFSHSFIRKDGRRFEAVYHYSLDTYLSSALDSLGGSTAVEFPTGNGKVDIFVTFKKSRYLIEVKSYADEWQIKKAKLQACRYAKTEGLNEVYLVIFTEVHPRDQLDVSSSEEIEGVTIESVLVNVNFEED